MKGAARIPPGQGVTSGWPVLHVGTAPEFDAATWRLRVHGEVECPFELNWNAFEALERCEHEADFHCVTGWSRLGLRWEGVALDTLLARAKATERARFVRFFDARFYDTTAPLGFALLADRCDGAPLAPEHGGPLRSPHRYMFSNPRTTDTEGRVTFTLTPGEYRFVLDPLNPFEAMRKGAEEKKKNEDPRTVNVLWTPHGPEVDKLRL